MAGFFLEKSVNTNYNNFRNEKTMTKINVCISWMVENRVQKQQLTH